MRIKLCFLCVLVSALRVLHAQGTVPTFTTIQGQTSLSIVGQPPDRKTTLRIPVLLVPVTLDFEAAGADGSSVVMKAEPDVAPVLASPVFSRYYFASGGRTQFADALLRSTFRSSPGWHTLLRHPAVKPITVKVPVGFGYILHSRRDAASLGVADADFVQRELFRQVSAQPGLGKSGTLVLAITHNTTFYVDGDATICCTWGTHGIDSVTGNSFVMASFLERPPAVVADRDIQPITEQLAEFLYDPRHDPQHYGYNVTAPGNAVPPWMWPGDSKGCGGPGIASSYFLLEPTDVNLKNNFPASSAYVARVGAKSWHLQNVALLRWYAGDAPNPAGLFSFPDKSQLTQAATPCSTSTGGGAVATAHTDPAARSDAPFANGHGLVGYWTGRGLEGQPFRLSEVPPQWDIVIVAFAAPVPGATEGTLQFTIPRGLDPDQLKLDIKQLQGQGRKVMISLGGGGAFFKLEDPAHIATFVASVTQVVEQYGFDGIDIDFETPSLLIQAGDKDPRHPTTPSIVNLISGLRQIHEQFGPGFMISLVPEGPQYPAGYLAYGGQFGSYLPIACGLGDMLSFIDVQDYNTPPLEGLDGEIYQSHTADYDVALTELMLRSFHPGHDARYSMPPIAPGKVLLGFYTDYQLPEETSEAVKFLIDGKPPSIGHYQLQQPAGYPSLFGAMFWTIDDDRVRSFSFSNLLGPQLHGYAPTPQPLVPPRLP